MKIADAKKLYELGGEPIDKLAARGLGYGDDWLAKLPDPERIYHELTKLPSNKQLRAIVNAGALAYPDLYLQAKVELEKRMAWSKQHEEKLRARHAAAKLVSKE